VVKRKDKIAAGLVKPPLSKYQLRKLRRANPDSPFAVLATLQTGDKDEEAAKA
jgi:hypothetical protein